MYIRSRFTAVKTVKGNVTTILIRAMKTSFKDRNLELTTKILA